MTEPIQAIKTLAFNFREMKGEEEVEGVDGNHFAWSGEREGGVVCDWLSDL